MALSGKLLRGTKLCFRFSSTAHNLQTTPFTVVARGPEVDGVSPEVVWRWRPGSDAGSQEFYWESATGKLVWKVPSSWTRAGFTVGSWKLYLLVGNPPTDQDNMTVYTLSVSDGRGNAPMPTTN